MGVWSGSPSGPENGFLLLRSRQSGLTQSLLVWLRDEGRSGVFGSRGVLTLLRLFVLFNMFSLIDYLSFMNSNDEFGYPDPNELLCEAENVVPRRILVDYSAVISTLKDDKNFTFREIAEWLNERCVPCDHNSVYREYTRRMGPADAAYASRDDDEIETRATIEEAQAKSIK